MIPACPQPEMTTKPLSVSTTSDMSSGTLSSTSEPSSFRIVAFEAPVSFRMRARNRPGQPDTRQNLCWPIDHDERAAELLISLLEQESLVGLLTVWPRTGKENPRADVRFLEGVRILLRQLSP